MSLRQSQSLLHTWSGLLVGWILFGIFLAGTVSFWRDEISRWARPELSEPFDRQAVLKAAPAQLARLAPNAKGWSIELPGDRNSGVLLRWQSQEEGGRRPRRGADDENIQWLDGAGKPVAVRETAGGDFFYRLHFDLHYVPVLWARWFVGFCSLLMLVAIVTGVITHKKIFRDFFTFGPGRRQRSWLDGHNAAAVLTLPFHLMITYTGLITLMTLYMPWPAVATYGSRQAMIAEQFPRPPEIERSGQAAPLVPLAGLVDRAEAIWGGRAGGILIAQPGDAAQQVMVRRRLADRIVDGEQTIRFDGTTGALLAGPRPESAGVVARGAMIGLHAGRFADSGMRWLLFLSGLAGTGMAASGLILWTVKRREKQPDPARPPFGFRTVERLNIAFLAGMPLAMTGFLWANRLLPLGTAARADAEIGAMFQLWAVAIVVAILAPTRLAWTVLLGATAASLAGLALADGLLTANGLPASLARGDWGMAAMGGGFLAFALLFAWLARHAARRSEIKRLTRRTPRPAAVPAE
jgi:uncharacterized iron-regulated membrane protein